MSWLLYVVLGLAGTWAVYHAYLYLATRSAEGRSAVELTAILPDLGDSRDAALIYCYTPQCRPCLGMTREVEALQAEFPRVYALDISLHLDIAQKLGIRATPTVLLVRGGQIERCVLGVRSRDFLRALLTG